MISGTSAAPPIRPAGCLRPGHALDRVLAELLWVLGELLLGHIGQEGRDLRAAGRQRAEGEAKRRPAQPRLPGALEVAAAHPRRPDRDRLVVVESLRNS